MISMLEALQKLLGLITVTAEVSDTKTLAASTDYAAEDVLSNDASSGTYFIFDNMAKKNGGSGKIEKAEVMLSVTALTPRITLYLFNRPPTSNLNDNAANAAPAVGDWVGYQGELNFPALKDLGGVSSTTITANTIGGLELPYKCGDTKRLYGIAVLEDAVTGESAGMLLGFKLQIRQD